MNDAEYWLLALAMGYGVGVLSGCFGAGGGFLLTPALNIFLGLPMNLAVGTGALQVTGTSALSLWRYERGHDPLDLRLAAAVGAGIPLGSYPGAHLVGLLKRHAPETMDQTLLAVFAVFLLAVGGWLVFDNFRSPERRGVPEGRLRGWRLPPLSRFDGLGGRTFSVPVLSGLGVGVGFLGGLLGIGGGVVMLPLLVYAVGVPAGAAARISSLLVLVSGLSSSGVHAVAGNIDYGLALILFLGSILGTRTGARLQRKLAHHALLGWFGVVVLLAWAVVTWRWLALRQG